MGVPLFPFGDDIRSLYRDGIDTIHLHFARPCKIYLDGEKRPCPNCIFDSMSKTSSGKYNGTGTRPFNRPPCPICKGSGHDPTSEEIIVEKTFRIEWDAKPYEVYNPGNFVKPMKFALIKGYANDIPLLLRMKFVVLDYENEKYMNEKYTLYKQPKLTGSISAGRYFDAYLQRIPQ